MRLTRNHLIGTVTAVLAAHSGFAPALAQNYVAPSYIDRTTEMASVLDRPRPEYDAKGLPLTPFRLFTGLDVSGAYDSNVFRRQNDVQSDFYLTTKPSFKLKSDWARHFLEISGQLTNYTYAKYEKENLTDWRVGADGRVDVSRELAFYAQSAYGQEHELWEAPNSTGFQSSPNVYFLHHTDAHLSYAPSRITVAVGGSYDTFTWLNTDALGGGSINNKDRNLYELQTDATVNYEFSPGYAAYFQAAYDERSFDVKLDRSGFARDSHGYRVGGGLKVKLAQLINGEIYGGYLVQNFHQDVATPLRDAKGFDYGVNVNWLVTPVVTLHLSASRQLIDTVLFGASMQDRQQVAVSGEYEFRPNIILKGTVGYMDDRFTGLTRHDKVITAGLGGEYLLNRYVGITTDYRYEDRVSSSSFAEFSDHIVTVGLKLHI